MKRYPSLRVLLLLSFGLITISLSAVSGLLVKQRLNYQIEANVSNNLQRITQEFSAQVSKSISDRYTTLQNLTTTLDFKHGNVNSAKLSEDLLKIKTVEPRFAWLGYADMNGKLIASTVPLLENTIVTDRTWFTAGLNGIYLSDIYDAPTMDKFLGDKQNNAPFRLVDISMPVRNDKGQVIGVLCANLSWAWVVDLQNAFDYPYVKQFNVQLFVINKNYKVLVGPDALIGAQLFEKTLANVTDNPNGPQSGFAHDSVNKEPYIIGYTLGAPASLTRDTLGWTVVAGRREAEAFKPIADANVEIAAVAGGATILVLLLSSLLAYKLTQPLNKMIEEMKVIIQKVMDVNSDVKIQHDEIVIEKGYQEIHELSSEFNAMIKAIVASELNKKYYEAIVQKHIVSKDPCAPPEDE